MAVENGFFENPEWKNKEQIQNFLQKHTQWDDLPPSFQEMTLQTTEELIGADSSKVLVHASSLDQEDNPYLTKIKKDYGTLENLYKTTATLLTEKHAQLFLRIETAQRLLTKRISKIIDWDPKNGFGTYSHYVKEAQMLCRKAVGNFSSP